MRCVVFLVHYLFARVWHFLVCTGAVFNELLVVVVRLWSLLIRLFDSYIGAVDRIHQHPRLLSSRPNRVDSADLQVGKNSWSFNNRRLQVGNESISQVELHTYRFARILWCRVDREGTEHPEFLGGDTQFQGGH